MLHGKFIGVNLHVLGIIAIIKYMLYLGSDHRGFKLKEYLKNWLNQKKIPFIDLGNTIYDSNDDHVDFAEKVGKKVAEDEAAKGILICGSGIGISIAANKIKGIRAGLVFSKEAVIHAREADNINIIALSGDTLQEKEAEDIVFAFLDTQFQPEERYLRRIDKIKKIETQ